MLVSLIATGSEFTRGDKIEKNCSYLASALTELGHTVEQFGVASDDQHSIERQLRAAVACSDAVFVTGGLGPTLDDLTRFAAAEVSGKPLFFYQPSWQRMQALFKKFGAKCSENNRVQAMFPQGCQVIVNENGTADGFMIRIGGTACYFLPGVPSEMRYLFTKIKDDFILEKCVYACHYLFLGPGESLLDAMIREKIAPLLSDQSSYAICVQYRFYVVQFLLDSAASRSAVKKAMREVYAECQIARRKLSPWQCLVEYATRKNIKFGFAESCTGGLLGASMTDVAGSSSVFLGSVVSYSNAIKQKVLSVSQDVLDQQGAVSEQCAREMASGARKLLGVDISLAITGIAGPGGGSKDKPVGTVWFAVDNGVTSIAEQCTFRGDRYAVREGAAWHALALMFKDLKN